jgi:hypothetical protein
MQEPQWRAAHLAASLQAAPPPLLRLPPSEDPEGGVGGRPLRLGEGLRGWLLRRAHTDGVL